MTPRDARIARMHAEWAAQRAAARAIPDPYAELRAIEAAARDLERRLGIVAWAFDKSGMVEAASDQAGALVAAVTDAVIDVETEMTEEEAREDALRQAQDARRKEAV